MADPGAAGLSVDVLGPLRCQVAGAEVELTRRQVRRLLAVLTSRAGQPVAVDDLIEALWPDDQPKDARAALRVVVSRLRTSLGAASDRLESSHEGVQLVPDRTDVARFTEIVDACHDAPDPATRANQLDEALALWRDRPYVDVPGPLVLEEHGRLLEEQLWYARQQWVEAAQQADHHDRVVRTAAGWVAAEPHRERLAADVARSLAATGRKATALETLETTRHHLRDTFGVDASDHLQTTEHEILTGAVQVGVREAAAPDTAETPMFGRDDEVARLLASTGTAFVVGEPGIGKSTLLTAFVGRVRADGRTVARAGANEALQRPMQPIADLVSQLAGGDPGRTPADLRRRLFPDAPVDVGESEVAVTRESLVRRCADHLRSLAPSDSATSVLDDVHWLDGLSSDVIKQVHADGGATLVLGSRPGARLEDELGGAVLVDLDALDEAAVRELVEFALPRVEAGPVAAEIHARSGGNPLFARMLVDMVAEGEDTLDHLPRSLLVAVQQRLDELRGRAVRALEIAAVLGPTFSLEVFDSLRPDDTETLDEAVEAGLIRIDRDAGRVSFVHALVAEGVYDLVPPARRLDLHDEVGRQLETSGFDVTEYVDHYEAAASIDPTRAVTALVDAGEVFADAFTWDVARRLFERAGAVQREQRRPEDALWARALIGLGGALRILGHADSTEALLAGARQADELDQPDLLVRSVIELCSHGRTLEAGQVHDEAAELLDQALALDLSENVRAELCATGSQLLSLSDQHSRSRALYLEAVELALALDRPDVDVAVFPSAHLGLNHPDDFELRRVAADRLSALGEHDTDLAWEAAFLRFGTAMVAGDGPDMWRQLDVLRELTPRVAARPRAFGMAFCETAAALIEGDLELAEEQMNRTLAEGQARYPESWVMMVYSSQLLAIRAAQGHLAELADVTAGLLAESPDFPTWHVAAGIAALEAGDERAARTHLAFLRRDDFAALIPDLTWTACVGFVGRIAVTLDDTASAQLIHDLLLPHAGRMLWAGTCTYGPADEVLALIADHLGRPDEAEAHRQAAAELLTGLRRREAADN